MQFMVLRSRQKIEHKFTSKKMFYHIYRATSQFINLGLLLVLDLGNRFSYLGSHPLRAEPGRDPTQFRLESD